MRLKLRLLTGVAGAVVTDLVVAVDDTATVAELIDALTLAEPWLADVMRSLVGPTLVIEADTARATAVADDALIVSSGLRSGHAIAFGSAGELPGRALPSEVGTLIVTSGPDAPREYRLPPGRYLIGRGPAASIRLTDNKVSARHAWLIADGTAEGIVELIDDGSANGTRINGLAVDRGELSQRELCTIGNSTLTVIANREQPTLERGGSIGFIRSPRIEPTFVGPKIVAPRLPRPADRAPFPLITTLAPLVMIVGVVVLIGGLGSIAFFVLMPMLSVAAWWEQRRHDRRGWKQAVARFHGGVARLADELDLAVRDEIAGREREQPGPDVLLEAARSHQAILWTRRPEHRRFGMIRIGRADDVSRVRIEREANADSGADTERLEELLNETIADRRLLTDVPLSVDLDEIGNLGLAGRRASVDPMIRAIVVHLATLYSPTEMQLVALDEAHRRWMRWLPHCDALGETIERAVASGASSRAATLSALVDLVAQRRQRAGADHGADHGTDDGPLRLPRVVVVADDDALDQTTLIAVAEVGPSVGVHLIWAARTVARVPAACRAFVDLHAGGSDSERGRLRRARLGVVDGGRLSDEQRPLATDFVVDMVGGDAAEWAARWLSPLVDIGASQDRAADVPHRLSLLDLLGHDLAERPESVIERWATVDRVLAGLRSPIGGDGLSLRSLDLRVDGPHALVAGTTGAGKSEFLQTWIVAMALSHPPEHFTVLLVDYKGGSAFSDCQHLPHCVGLVTDLTPHLVARALASLRAELRRREHLFERLGVSDLAACEVQFPDDCPPSLVIVVDEFAALVTEVPEFVSGVVDVAQRGRSLGLHLVLATQRPAGVITDQVRANTNLRIALRMADTDDSIDVIGNSDAAHFDPRTPGRASVRLGSAAPSLIQVAYVGGVTAVADRRDAIDVGRWDLEAVTAHQPDRADAAAISVVQPDSMADLTRLVATIRAAAAARPLPRKPWLPELAERYRLEALPTERTDLALVIGVADRPRQQLQTTLSFDPERDGHLVVLGGGKAGKSTTLRTIVAAAGWAGVRGGPTHIYALQFGSRSLDSVAALAHVGTVVNGSDVEHVERTVTYLRGLVEQRQHDFAAVAASSLTDYRAQSDHLTEPRLIVMVDGLGRFRDEFESGRLHAVFDEFVSLIADGRAVGVHVVVTATRPAELGSVVLSLIHRRLVLRLGDENDVAAIGVPSDFFDRETPPGRGWCDGDEFQVAVLGGDGTLAGEAGAFDELGKLLDQQSTPRARPLEPAPVAVRRADLKLSTADSPGARPAIALGLDLLSAGTVTVEPVGVLVVSGVRGSGVMTTVTGLVDELITAHEAVCVLLGSTRSAMLSSPTFAPSSNTRVVVGGDQIAEAATALVEVVRQRRGGPDSAARPMVVVIDNLDDHLDGVAEDALVDLVGAAHDGGVFVIVTADPSTLAGSWPLQQAVRSGRRGVMLRPDPLDIEAAFGITVKRLLGIVPPGRASYIDGDVAVTIQVAIGVSSACSHQP